MIVFYDHPQVSFHDLGTSQSNLDTARLKIKDAAAKAWSNYLGLEKKGHATVKEVIYANVYHHRIVTLCKLFLYILIPRICLKNL